MRSTRDLSVLLPRVAGRQKRHDIDFELFPCRLSDSEMTEVGWIERPPEERTSQVGASTSAASIGGSSRKVPPIGVPGQDQRCGSTYVPPRRAEMWTADRPRCDPVMPIRCPRSTRSPAWTDTEAR